MNLLEKNPDNDPLENDLRLIFGAGMVSSSILARFSLSIENNGMLGL
jgi:hypothetical protein